MLCLPWSWQPLMLHLGDLLQSMTCSPMLVFAVHAKERSLRYKYSLHIMSKLHMHKIHALHSQAGITR